mgnify:CR=1 FL=1
MSSVGRIFVGVILLLLLVLGAYVVGLVFGVSNFLLAVGHAYLHVSGMWVPVKIIYYVFYVAAAGIIVALLLYMFGALRSLPR